jgi:hypothetical protein
VRLPGYILGFSLRLKDPCHCIIALALQSEFSAEDGLKNVETSVTACFRQISVDIMKPCMHIAWMNNSFPIIP